MAQRRDIPKPRHLFPETAAFLIGLRRTALYFGFGSRAAIGRIPIWIVGSLAGLTCVMLTISLFFLREDAVAAPVNKVPTVQTSIPQSMPTILIPAPLPSRNSGSPNIAMDFVRTNFPFPFDEFRQLTVTSLDQATKLPALAGRDLWRQTIQRPSSLSSFSSWLEIARALPANLGGLMASNQVPLQLAPDASRELGLLVQKTPLGRGTPGERVSYDIVIINVSLKTIEQIVVREKISELHRVTEVLPSAHLSQNELVWTLNSLEPGAIKRLNVTLIPEIAGEILTETLILPTTQLSATVNVRAPEPPKVKPAPVQTPVEAPKAPELKLTYTSLQALKQGEILSLTFSVTNVGNAPAEDVQLYVRLSGEFEHRYGEYVHHRMGQLQPGQTRRALLQATAKEIGNARLSTSLTMQGTEAEARELKIPIARSAPGINGRTEGGARRISMSDSPAEQWVASSVAVAGAKSR